MDYQTRHMEALKPMYHMGESLSVGESFFASAVDAGYYVKHGRAREIAMPASLIAPSEMVAQQPVEPPAVTEPVAVAESVEVESPPVDSPPVDSPADVAAAVEDQVPVVPTAPRRGRPPRVTTESQS